MYEASLLDRRSPPDKYEWSPGDVVRVVNAGKFTGRRAIVAKVSLDGKLTCCVAGYSYLVELSTIQVWIELGAAESVSKT